MPQFIIDMKSQPRSPKHGNRKPSPKTHGDPVDGAGTQYVRTSLPSTTWRTLNAGVAIDPTEFHSLTALDPSVIVVAIAEMQRLMAGWTQQVYDVTGIRDLETKPRSIPHCGIQAGELTGYRLWWVDKSGLLRSLVRDEVYWTPGEAMKGDIEQVVHTHFYDRTKNRYGGVYSFKDQAMAKMEFIVGRDDLREYPHHADPGTVGFALGTVKLWGEVVEHEHGYRASFAKPASLDDIYYYGTPAKDPKGLYF